MVKKLLKGEYIAHRIMKQVKKAVQEDADRLEISLSDWVRDAIKEKLAKVEGGKNDEKI